MNNKQIQILYTNWKNETRERIILPIRIEFKSTTWHQEEQWILVALDLEKNEERSFAIKDIKSWDIFK